MMDYSRIAGDYEKVESVAKTLLLLVDPTVTRFLSPPIGKMVLNFGCGTGIFSRYLNDRGAQVTNHTGWMKSSTRRFL